MAENRAGAISYWPRRGVTPGGRAVRLIVIALLLAWGAQQFHKSLPPVRTDAFLWDFSNVYCASRTMLAGQDPFQIDRVEQTWLAAPHSRLAPENRGWLWVWCAVYPPPSLVAIAPLAMLSPSGAHLVWIISDIVLFCLMCLALWKLAGIDGWIDRLLLVACLLAAAPVVDVIQSGQLGFPACAGVILAVWALQSKKPTLAGIILGLATAVKFQVAGPFILFYLLIRQWRVATVALGLFVGISLIGIVPLQIHGIPWLHEWLANSAATLAPGGGNDPRPFTGPFRNDLINVQVWLCGLTSNARAVNLATGILTAGLIVMFLAALRRRGESAHHLLALSCVALLSSLPVYRRLYDTTVLALLLAWAIAMLNMPMRRWALLTLLLLAELLLPVEIVPMMLRHVHVSAAMTDSRAWQAFVVPHHAWAILLLTVWTCGLYGSLADRRAAGSAMPAA